MTCRHHLYNSKLFQFFLFSYELCRLLILRLQYKKTSDDIIHGLFNNLVEKDFTSLTTYFYHSLFELLDQEMIHLNNHIVSDLYLKLQDR